MDSYAVAQDMAWANRTFEGDVKQLLDADFDSVKIVRKKPPNISGALYWQLAYSTCVRDHPDRMCRPLSNSTACASPGCDTRAHDHHTSPNALHRITAAMIKPRDSRLEWSTSKRPARPFSLKTATSTCRRLRACCSLDPAHPMLRLTLSLNVKIKK